MLWENLAEEQFFYLYHLHLEPEKTNRIPINLRRWLIERFIIQKEKEEQAIESSRKKASRK